MAASQALQYTRLDQHDSLMSRTKHNLRCKNKKLQGKRSWALFTRANPIQVQGENPDAGNEPKGTKRRKTHAPQGGAWHPSRRGTFKEFTGRKVDKVFLARANKPRDCARGNEEHIKNLIEKGKTNKKPYNLKDKMRHGTNSHTARHALGSGHFGVSTETEFASGGNNYGTTIQKQILTTEGRQKRRMRRREKGSDRNSSTTKKSQDRGDCQKKERKVWVRPQENRRTCMLETWGTRECKTGRAALDDVLRRNTGGNNPLRNVHIP